jgi:hypothetical protein
MATDYTCARCGAYVFTAVVSQPPEHGLCFVCAFVVANVDPEERQAVLDHLDRDLADDN